MQIPGLSVAASSDLTSLPWRDTRYAGVAWVDLARADDGTTTALIRMSPGCGYPAHRHVGAEDVLVLAGGYRDDDGREHRAGDFVRYGPGSVHEPVALDGPEARDCLLFAVAHRGTEVIDRDA